jgi:hypothetical protein
MFVVSIAYVAIACGSGAGAENRRLPPCFTGAMLRTAREILDLVGGPHLPFTVQTGDLGAIRPGIAIVSIGLLAFASSQVRAGDATRRSSAWQYCRAAPVLRCATMMTEYYVYLPVIGLCWLGGWAVRGMARGFALCAPRIALAAAIAGDGGAEVVVASEWSHAITVRVRDLGKASPARTSVILVSRSCWWASIPISSGTVILDKPFRLFGRITCIGAGQ